MHLYCAQLGWAALCLVVWRVHSCWPVRSLCAMCDSKLASYLQKPCARRHSSLLSWRWPRFARPSYHPVGIIVGMHAFACRTPTKMQTHNSPLAMRTRMLTNAQHSSQLKCGHCFAIHSAYVIALLIAIHSHCSGLLVCFCIQYISVVCSKQYENYCDFQDLNSRRETNSWSHTIYRLSSHEVRDLSSHEVRGTIK